MKLGARIASCAVVLVATRVAAACDGVGPAIHVRFAGQSSEAFERAVLADLEAGLSRNNLSVCALGPEASPPATRAVAELLVESKSPESVDLSVRVLEGKEARFERRVELGQVPADSRTFAIALAADELLRAGGVEWLDEPVVELKTTPRVEPATAPAEEQDHLASSGGETELAAWSLGARAALERFGGGQTLWGGDAALLVPLPARLELQLAPGIRRGLEVSEATGRIESSALSLSANARYRLIEAGWQLSAGLGLYGARLVLEGSSTAAGTTASRFTGVALYGQALLSASLPIAGPLRFELSGVLGVPLRELEATADGRVATAVSGLQLGVLSAIWWQL